jgi:DNA-binding CsgD family transcriptional regulator
MSVNEWDYPERDSPFFCPNACKRDYAISGGWFIQYDFPSSFDILVAMPILLLSAFFSASIGLASLAFASILFAHRPTRVTFSFICVDFSAWLLVLKVLGGCFYWQTGSSFYVWITGVNHLVSNVPGVFLAIACVVYTFPVRDSGPDVTRSPVPFLVSCVFFACAVLSGLFVEALFPPARFAPSFVVWIGSFAFLGVIAIAALFFNGPFLRKSALFAPLVATAILAPALAIAPYAFQLLSLEASAIPLIISILLSVCAFTMNPAVRGREKSANRAGEIAQYTSDPVLAVERESNADGCLSSREKDISALILDGKTNGEIAEMLYISRKTVETHLHNIFRKLGVTNRVQLVRRLLSNDQ